MIPVITHYRPFGQPAHGWIAFPTHPTPPNNITLVIGGNTYISGIHFTGRDSWEMARSLTAAINADFSDLNVQKNANVVLAQNINPIKDHYALYYGLIVTVIATEPGTAGNALALSSDSAYITVSGTTFTGGTSSTSLSFTVPNLAALYLVASPYHGQIMWVTGAVTPGDGGGGGYYFDSTSMAVDDGVTVIRPTAITVGNPGRWLKFV